MKQNKLMKLNEQIIKDYRDMEIVLGDGQANSKIVLIGEAPGSKEVELKKPFVGQAGKHLEEFLSILNLSRKDLYITNVVKYRPTRESKKTGNRINRTPSKKEIDLFKKFLFSEIEIIEPKIIVTLGNIPLTTIFDDNKTKIGEVHGKLLNKEIRNKEYDVFPLYHPAAVIYRKQLKKVYLEDLFKLKNIMKK